MNSRDLRTLVRPQWLVVGAASRPPRDIEVRRLGSGVWGALTDTTSAPKPVPAAVGMNARIGDPHHLTIPASGLWCRHPRPIRTGADHGTYSESHPMPVVRRPGRSSGSLLHEHLQEFEDGSDLAIW